MRWKTVLIIAFIGFVASTTPAAALTILGNFRALATGPDNDPSFGGGNIQDIFETAASFWEQSILDDVVVPIDYSWQEGFGPLAFAFGDGRSGSIFVPTGHDLFLDPTPDQNEEYTTPVSSFATIDGQVLNYGVGLTGGSGAADGFDLLTLLIHEIGHVIGHVTSHFTDVDDGDVDITAPLPLAGLALPVFGGCCHLDTPVGYAGVNPSMFPFTDVRERRFISDADLLFVAQGGEWQQLDPSRFAVAPEPTTVSLIGLAAISLHLRRRRRR